MRQLIHSPTKFPGAVREPTIGSFLQVASALEIRRFLEGAWPGYIVIAELPADIRSRLATSTEVVLLSRYTAEKQKKHPEIGSASFLLLQDLLDRGERHYDRSAHVTVIQLRDQPYVAVIKATQSREEVYLQSFRRTDPKNIESIRKRNSGR